MYETWKSNHGNLLNAEICIWRTNSQLCYNILVIAWIKRGKISS